MGIVFSKEDEKYDKDNVLPTVLLLGNGFDLQIGLKSRYEDFFLYLFFLKVLHLLFVNKIEIHKNDFLKVLKEGEEEYFGNYEFSDSKSNFLSILEIAEKRLHSFEKENRCKDKIFEKNRLVSCIVSILSQNENNPLSFKIDNPFGNLNIGAWTSSDCKKKCSDKKDSSSNELDIVELNVTSLKEDIKLFLKIIKGEDGKKNVNGWMDIESVIECLITKNEISMSRFFNYEDIDNSNKEKITFFDFCYELNLTENYDKAHELMQSLKQFTDEFCKFIQIQVDHLKDQKELIEILKNELNREISFYKPSQDAPFIEKIDIFNNIHKVINYNYSTLSELFTEYSKNTIHVNGKSEDETAIFGINEDIELKNQETLNKYVIYLFKQTQRIINHIPRFTDEQLNLLESNHFSSNSQTKLKEDVHGFNLIIYGHSCYPQKSVIHNFNSTRSPIKYAA